MNLIGSLLIAPPSVKGNFWYKTVVMITEHNSHGSVGLVLNKRSTTTVSELGEKLNLDIDIPGFIYIGGPINANSLSIIHSNEWCSSNTLRINNEFSLSSSEDMLPRFANGDIPRRWRMFAGMSGWGPTQLEAEIKGSPPYQHDTSWCLTSSNSQLVFNYDGKEQWNTSLEQAGVEFAQNILI